MSNSKLVSYTKISPNRTVNSNRKIDTITIHCMAGNLSVEGCGSLFAKASRAASSNYGIGSDGRIGLYVEEKDRSWCSSNRENDMRAITIEVANDGGAPDWHVSDKAYESLINLLVDICQRNNIDALRWKNDKSLIGQVDKQNMTVHRWFANKSCPGEYLMSKMGDIANEVNKRLGATVNNTVEVKEQTSTTYTKTDFIRELQAAIGAKVDGIAGPETLSKTPTLCVSRNKKHKAVLPVQKYLYALGYTEVGKADGIAGAKFTAAVKRYQKEVVKLKVPDGIISARKNTWKKLLGLS